MRVSKINQSKNLEAQGSSVRTSRSLSPRVSSRQKSIHEKPGLSEHSSGSALNAEKHHAARPLEAAVIRVSTMFAVWMGY